MNLWNIAIKEIRSDLRDRRTFLFMLALPITLMLILGAALSNAFTPGHSIENMQFLYKTNTTDPNMLIYWDHFTETIKREGVTAVQVDAEMDGVEEVRANRFTAYAILEDDGITFYGSNKYPLESNIVQGMLTAFADRFSLATAVFQVDPSAAKSILVRAGQSSDFIREMSLQADKKPGSFDYYAIAMTTMMAFYSAISALYLFRSERIRNTAVRLMAAPVSKSVIFVGKIIGCTFVNFLCVLIVILFSKFVYHADWGNHYGMVVLVLLTELLLAVSVGLGVSFLIQGEGARAVVLIFTQISSFLGGAYFPIGDVEGVLDILTNLSPIRWANLALMQIIYADNPSAAWPAIGLNTSIALVFLFFASISIRKRGAF